MAKKTEDTSNFNFNINSKSKSSGFSETADQFTRLSEAMERAATAASAFVTGVEEINKAPDISKKLKEFSQNAQKYDIPETYINNASRISRTSLNHANSEKRHAEAMLKEQEALVLEYKRERGLLQKQHLADIALEKSKSELAKQQAALKKEQARLEKLFGEQVKQASIDNQKARTRQANARASNIEAQVNSGFWDARTATEKAREQYYLNNTYAKNSFNTFSAGYISHNMPFQNVPVVGNLIRSYGYSLGEQVRRGNISKTGVFAMDAVVGITQLSDALIKLGKSAVNSYIEIEKLQTSLEVAYGSKADAQRMFGEITEYAIRSPYTISGTTGIATRLKQSGVADKDLMTTIQELGDLAGGNEEKLSRIATNYTQIIADGRAMTRDLREFANAGIPIYQELSKIMGKSVKEVRELAKQGELTSDYIEEALKNLTSEGGAFYNAVEKGAETLQGRITNMKDTIKLAGSELGEIIANIGYKSGTSIFDGVISTITDSANDIREYFKTYNLEKDLYISNQSDIIDLSALKDIPIDRDWANTIRNDISEIAYNTSDKEGNSVSNGYIGSLENLFNPEQLSIIEQLVKYKGYSVDGDSRRSAGYNAYASYLDYAEIQEKANVLYDIIESLPDLNNFEIDSDAYNTVIAVGDIIREAYAELDSKSSRNLNFNTEANRRLYNQQTGINTANTAFDILSDNSKYKSSMESLTTSMEELYKATDEYKKAQEKSKYATLEEAQSKLDELEMIKYYQGQGLSPYAYIMSLYDQGNVSGAENAFKTFFTSTGTQFDVSPEGMANISNATALSNNIRNTYRDIENYLPYLKNRNDIGFDAPIQSILSSLNSAARKQDAELISNLIGEAQIAINGDALTETGKSIYQGILNALITSFEIDSEDFENNISAIQRQRLQEVANNVLNTVVNQITNLQNSGFNVSDIINSLPSVASKKKSQNQQENIDRLQRYYDTVIASGEVSSLADLYTYIYGRGRDVNNVYTNTKTGQKYSVGRTSEIFGYTLGTGNLRIGNQVTPIESSQASEIAEGMALFAQLFSGNEFVDLRKEQRLSVKTLEDEKKLAALLNSYFVGYSNSSNITANSINGKMQDDINEIESLLSSFIDGLKVDLGLKDVNGQEQEVITNLRSLIVSAIHGVNLEYVTPEMIKELSEEYESSYIPLWKQIINNTLGVPVDMIKTEGSAFDLYKELNNRKTITSLTSYLLGSNNANDVMSAYVLNQGGVTRDKSGRYVNTTLNSEETLKNLLGIDTSSGLYSAYYSSLADTQNQLISFLSQAETTVEDITKLTSDEYKEIVGKFSGELADYLRVAFNDGLSNEDIMDYVKTRLEEIKLEEKYIDTLRTLVSTTEQLNSSTERITFSMMYTSDGSLAGNAKEQYASSVYDTIKKESSFNNMSYEQIASLINAEDSSRFAQLYFMGRNNGLSREDAKSEAQRLVESLKSLETATIANTAAIEKQKLSQNINSLTATSDESFLQKSIKETLGYSGNYDDIKSLLSDDDISKLRTYVEPFGINADAMEIDELLKTVDAVKQVKDAFNSLGDSIKNAFDTGLANSFSNTFNKIGKNIATTKDAMEGIGDIWADFGIQMTNTLGTSLTQCGLAIATHGALEGAWGLVGAGLAMAAGGGIFSFLGGLWEGTKDGSDDDDTDKKIQQLQDLEDMLDELLNQAKTDAEYYESEFRHQKTISRNNIYTESVNDAIITPSGKVISTAPDDWLIATKTPQSLGSSPSVNITFINESGNPVAIGRTEESKDSFGNIDIKAYIVSTTAEAISNGELDTSFSARESRLSGKVVSM